MSTHPRRGSRRRSGAAVLAVAAALSGGCSILFHIDASQCATDADCSGRGPAFMGYTCDKTTGTCVKMAPDSTSPQCTTTPDCTASRGPGYACSQGMCVAAMSMLDGAADTSSEPSVDGTTGAESEAEAEAQATCSSNADCAPTGTHPEVACNVDTHTCLQLTSDECPYVIGDYTGSVAAPILIGAFADLPANLPLSHPSYLNYALVLSEFSTNTHGIPAGPGTKYRMPVAVVCDVSTTNIDKAMLHLINELQVPSIVAPLPPTTLSTIFMNYAASNTSDIFIINPLSWDPILGNLTTDGLMWHMLGQPGDNAPAYAAFLSLIEHYVRNTAPWNLGPTAPLKVATVTANATATNELAAAVEKVLVWNGGMTIAQNGNSYLSVGISDSTLNGTDLKAPALVQSISNAEQQLLAFRPNVIVSFASYEFTSLIENLEIDWPGSVPPPFYLLGPYNMGDTLLQGDLKNYPPGTDTRFAGIGVASTTDTQVLSDYETRFLTQYTGDTAALGEENYYDAMYFAVYSLVAAGRIAATGSDIAAGMKHLISLTSPQYKVGPADMGNIYSALSVRGSIELIGALGPPNFDTATGARIGEGDVYCIGHNTDGGTPAYPYLYDVLRLTNSDGGAPLIDGGGAFQGTFPCYPGIQ